MEWEAMATGGAALVALIFAWWQLSEMKRQRRAKLALPLFQEMRSPEARQSVRKIIEIYKENKKRLGKAANWITKIKKRDPQNPDIANLRTQYEGLTMPRQDGDVGDIVNKLDLLGLLVAEGLIKKNIAMAVTRTSALRIWYILALCTDYVQKKRSQRGHYAIFAEDYARRCLLYEIDRVPEDERTKLEGHNLVEALCEMYGVSEASNGRKLVEELKKRLDVEDSMMNEYTAHFRKEGFLKRCIRQVTMALF